MSRRAPARHRQPPVNAAGRLVAVEATRARDIDEAARRVWDALRARGAEGGISRWDASGTFFEARQVKKKEFVPSPRTLLLFYAVDLQFRLKWEIEPLLAEGQHGRRGALHRARRGPSAAPQECPKAWLDAVLAPVPPADVTLRAKERKPSVRLEGRRRVGFCETCAAAMRNGRQRFDPVGTPPRDDRPARTPGAQGEPIASEAGARAGEEDSRQLSSASAISRAPVAEADAGRYAARRASLMAASATAAGRRSLLSRRVRAGRVDGAWSRDGSFVTSHLRYAGPFLRERPHLLDRRSRTRRW